MAQAPALAAGTVYNALLGQTNLVAFVDEIR